MVEEYEKQFELWFSKWSMQTNRLDVVSVAKQAFLAGFVAAQHSVQPTVLTHSPNCALVKSLVADCNCGFDKSHSG